MDPRFSIDEDRKYKKIFGAVAWPGKRAGFAVIIGQRAEWSGACVLLDETEAADIRQLVRACGGLDYFYRPDGWYGDSENRAACEFIREMNQENRQQHNIGRTDFVLRRSRILDIKNVFDFVYPTLKKMLAKGSLTLKDSKLTEYMLQVQASDLPAIDFGDYPAVEALAFAVLELERNRDSKPKPTHADNNYPRT